MKRLANGFSLVEVLVAGALSVLVISFSIQPILQMNRLGKTVEFQGELSLSHLQELQKARNSHFLKENLGITINDVIQPAVEACYGGRGTNCTAYSKASGTLIDTSVSYPGAQSSKGANVRSTIEVSVTCTATACRNVTLLVSTVETAHADDHLNWDPKPLVATLTVPAAALSSRQEIDFSGCVNKAITGINFDTLTAECAGFTGTQSCQSIAASGPLATFGQSNLNDPANCQPPVNTTCSEGLQSVGMINGQASCATALSCNDPLSTACNPPVVPITAPVTPCTSSWQPDVNTVCLGQTFTQTDANNCPLATPQSAVGTNAAKCPLNSCTSATALRWPDPVRGPCGNASGLGTAGAGTSAAVSNQNLGFLGTYMASCVDNSPAPSTFNVAAATSTCTPISCNPVPGSIRWNGSKTDDGSAGPWDCSGPLTITQASAQPAGVLLSLQADPSAKAVANNTAATASSGTAEAVCNDPGPVTASRNGVLSYSVQSCKPTAPVGNLVCNFPGSMEVCSVGADNCDTGGWNQFSNWYNANLVTAGMPAYSPPNAGAAYNNMVDHARNIGFGRANTTDVYTVGGKTITVDFDATWTGMETVIHPPVMGTYQVNISGTVHGFNCP